MRVKLAALAIAIASLLFLPSFAEADTFQYDFTEPTPPPDENINIVFTITGTTVPTSGDITSFTSTMDPFANVTEFAWASDASNGDCLGASPVGFGCVAFNTDQNIVSLLVFPTGSFLSPGTYTGADGATLVITDLSGVSAPEPSSFLLLGAGLLGLGPIVRRFTGARR